MEKQKWEKTLSQSKNVMTFYRLYFADEVLSNPLLNNTLLCSDYIGFRCYHIYVGGLILIIAYSELILQKLIDSALH